MTTQTARTRRRGPMSPEEMIDLQNQNLRVDEALVSRLVDEAKADYGENLMEPIQAWINTKALWRHRQRFVKVMGTVARLKTNGKLTLLAAAVIGLFFGFLLYNQEHPWFVDLFFALVFGGAATIGAMVNGGYKLAFSKVYALERRDFTDPSFVTGWVRVFIASLCFYYRSEVWRGNDGHTGVNNPDSFVVLACGLDDVQWDLRRRGRPGPGTSGLADSEQPGAR